MLEKLFKLKENNTTLKTEIIAGITTFMTMAYILAVNPDILGDAGMDKNAILIASALASFIGCLFMALFANYPFALAPGMGLNAYFTYSVVIGMGISWQFALFTVFVEGLIFILLSATNVREAIFNAIPSSLKLAVSGGIGLFIALIGFLNSKIAVSSASTTISLRDFSSNFHSESIGAILALIGVIITVVLLTLNIKGGILYGILTTWILGIVAELVELYVPNLDIGMYSTIPNGIISFNLTSLEKTAFKVFTDIDFSSARLIDFVVIIFSFLFVDLFDTLGTLIGVSTKANMLDAEGKLPRIKGALFADALATSIGAMLGTSTTTTFVESASGVSEGGRTGLTSIVTGFLFLISIFFSPLFLAIPSFATAPALIVVGFYMLTNVVKINFDDMSEAIPAFLCIIAMPFTYSISEGISIGVISYVLINLLTGKYKEKKISAIMYVLTILFILKYIFF